MRICKNCGYEMDDNHKFCPECGVAVTDELTEPSGSQLEENSTIVNNGKLENQANIPEDDVTNCGDNAQRDEEVVTTVSDSVKKSNKSKKLFKKSVKGNSNVKKSVKISFIPPMVSTILVTLVILIHCYKIFILLNI